MALHGWVLAGGLGFLLASAAPGAAQTDLARMLVGRWTGDVQTSTGTYARTLVIQAVGERNGQMVATAEYGGPGGYAGGRAGLSPIQALVEMVNGEVVLRFSTAEYAPVVLTLQRDGRHLLGKVSGWSYAGKSRGGDDGLRLERTQ